MSASTPSSEITELASIPTWASRAKEHVALLKHPQLKLINRIGGLEDLTVEPPPVEQRPAPDSELNAAVSVWFGDVTRLRVDAVVNAAHSGMSGGGGVDGAIHSAAGDELVTECLKVGPCPPGECRITGAYRLPAKIIIHTVGPYGEDPKILASCYANSLDAAARHGSTSIAFVCISAGHYKYPSSKAANIALATVRSWLSEHRPSDPSNPIKRVVFAVKTVKDEICYEELIPYHFPFP